MRGKQEKKDKELIRTFVILQRQSTVTYVLLSQNELMLFGLGQSDMLSVYFFKLVYN